MTNYLCFVVLCFPIMLPSPVRSIIDSTTSKLYKWRVRQLAASVGEPLYVNGYTVPSQETVIGDNALFNGLRVQGGGPVEIGDNFRSAKNCLILTRNHNFRNAEAVPYDSKYIEKKVTIDGNVWMGHSVIVLPGVDIGEGAIIQAGSVVCSDIPRCGIAGGHPAEVFDKRDEQQYDRLKSQNRIHEYK